MYDLNPMVGVVYGFRWAILGIEPGPGTTTLLLLLSGLLVFAVGSSYLTNVERTMADEI